MFVDRVEVDLIAGKGGNGCMAFRRKSMCLEEVPAVAMAAMAEASFWKLGKASIRC